MLEKITCCKKACIECGFLYGSVRGSLWPSTVNYILDGRIFPCHMELKKVTGSENTGVEIYCETVKEIRICRGLIQSMYKSVIEPKNKAIEKLYELVKDDDMSNVMNIDEVVKYHIIGVMDEAVK